MHYTGTVGASAAGHLSNALKRIRRRLAGKRWEMDGAGRIRCEILPRAGGHPRRTCCPLGMLAAEAPRARLDRTLRDRTNADWTAAVEAFVNIELRSHVRELRRQSDGPPGREYTERELVRVGVGLAVCTAPWDHASEGILAMVPATIRLLSEATDHPDTYAGILLTRALRADGNTLAEDFRAHFRQTVEEAAVSSRAAHAIHLRRLKRLAVDIDEREGGTAGLEAPGRASLSVAASRFGAGLRKMLGGCSM